MRPPTPNLDLVLHEADSLFRWWLLQGRWHGLVTVIVLIFVAWAFIGGLRACFWVRKP